MRMPVCGRASPSMDVSMPAMIRNSVDLPDPFRPSTPILAPGKKDRLMSRRMTRFGGTTRETRFIVYMYCAIGFGRPLDGERAALYVIGFMAIAAAELSAE